MNKIITVTELLTFARRSCRMICEEKKKKKLIKEQFYRGYRNKEKREKGEK